MKSYVSSTERFYCRKKVPEMVDEVSLSHLMREKNPFTRDGIPYGGQLARILKEKKLLPERPKILEIGPGVGDLARAFTGELEGKYEYTFLDISKRIIDFLRAGFSSMGFGFVVSDVLELSGKIGKYNTVICNEVLADLPMVINPSSSPAKPGKEERRIIRDARRMIKKYNLNVPEDRGVVFNYGAVRFLEEVRKVMKKGGILFLAENSCDPGLPRVIPVYGHNEFSIKFGWLKAAAGKLGFSTGESGKITELLEIRNREFLSMFLIPELKVIFDHLNLHDMEKSIISEGSKAMEVDEFLKFLDENQHKINIDDLDQYKKMLKRSAREINKVTDQFRYLILKKK